jgi:hypothetical protein
VSLSGANWVFWPNACGVAMNSDRLLGHRQV